MIYLLRKTITASAAQKLNFFQNFPSTLLLSVKYLSASANANQHSFTVSYLINSCGLSLESALSASKRVHFETPEKADLVLSLFEDLGFSKSQISVLVSRLPTLLSCNLEKTLLPKLNFFYSKGFTSPALVKLLYSQPSILARSLEKQTIPSFNFFVDLLNSNENAITAITRYPRMLSCNLGTYVSDNVRIMRDYGVPHSNIVTLLHYQPRTFSISPDLFKEIVEDVKKMGFDPSKMKFGLAVFAFRAMTKSTWERKVEAYKKWGWSEEEVLEAFRRNPWCMMASEEKISALMDYFVNEMGWGASFLFKRPALVTLSLEKRIVPRGSVYQVLLSKALVKENSSLRLLFEMPEKLFLEKFVYCYKEEAPELLKLYEDKSKCSR